MAQTEKSEAGLPIGCNEVDRWIASHIVLPDLVVLREIYDYLTRSDRDVQSEDTCISREEYDELIRLFASSRVNCDNLKELFSQDNVSFVQDKINEIIGSLNQDDAYRAILGILLDRPDSNYGNVTFPDIQRLISKYPTPIDFEEALRCLPILTSNKLISHGYKLFAFMEILYGEKFSKYQQMIHLVDEAKKHQISGTPDQQSVVDTTRLAVNDLSTEDTAEMPIDPKFKAVVPPESNKHHQTHTIRSNPSLAELLDAINRKLNLDQQLPENETISSIKSEILDLNLDDFASYNLQKISISEASGVMDNSEIHGTDYDGKTLTIDSIKQENLQPSYKLEAGNLNAYLSPIFNLGHRFAVLAYVEDGDDKYIVRTIYLSGSHCIWKQLPYYEYKPHLWYGKGRGQDAILADLPYQWATGMISQVQEKVLQVENPDLFFMGTAKNRHMAIRENQQITHFGVVEEKPKKLDGNFYKGDHSNNILTPPEEMFFDNESTQIPDFSIRVKNWKTPSNIYGDVSVDVFPSLDRQLTYVFCRDEEGRTWISGIYVNSRHTSTGTRSKWVDAGDLTTPAVAYGGEDGGYGDCYKKSGNYIDMFNNYISKIPVIQAYLRWVVANGSNGQSNGVSTQIYGKKNGLIN